MWWDVSTTRNSKEESAPDVNLENPNLGKTTLVLRLQKISLYQDYNNGAQRQQPLLLSFSVSSYTLNYITTTIIIQPTLHTHTIKFALGHIYTNMTFMLFTNVALMGSQEHIYMYVPSIRGEVLTGPATSGSAHFPSGGTCFPTHDSIWCPWL